MNSVYLYAHCLVYVMLALNLALKWASHEYAAAALYLFLAALTLAAHKAGS